MKVFKKVYEGEDLYDLENDIIHEFDKLYTEDPTSVFDDEGLLKGNFKVTIEVEK